MSRGLSRRVIVTGGTYGIGASIVDLLANRGVTVASLARSAELGRRQAAEATARGGGAVRFFSCDVADRDQVDRAVDDAVSWMGGLEGLVHVAGVEVGARPEDVTDEGWAYAMSVNATGTMLTNQAAFRHMRDVGGRIVNFGSGAGITGLAHSAAYAASKGAVAAWTRSAASAWGRHDITVNMICPAVVTPMYAEHRARMSDGELAAHDARMAERILIGGKLGDPERDVAPVVDFLLGEGARFITGQTIPLDGGALMVR